MTNELVSPAVLLQREWDRFQKEVLGAAKTSKTSLSKSLGFNAKQLRNWMSPSPKGEVIPFNQIDMVCTALLCELEVIEEIKIARALEMASKLGPLQSMLNWLSMKAADQIADQEFLSRQSVCQDERALLSAFRALEEAYPRGLYGDKGEVVIIGKAFRLLLKRAEKLHEEEDKAEAGTDSEAIARDGNFKLAIAKEKARQAKLLAKVAIARASAPSLQRTALLKAQQMKKQ